MTTIDDFGWNERLASEYSELLKTKWQPARVLAANKRDFLLMGPRGPLTGILAGNALKEMLRSHDFPVAGDWVAVVERECEAKAIVHALLPRKTRFARKAPSSSSGLQVIAANLDVLFLVTSLNAEFKPRRLERYFMVAWEAGARPVLVLNKADLCESVEALASEARAVAGAVPVVVASALQGLGIDEIHRQVGAGQTAAFVGSSGVGKSSLVNALLGEQLRDTVSTSELGDRGRHTTTRAELVRLASGGLLLDTPGLREIGMPGDTEADDCENPVFDDIDALAERCRFSNCRHETEPGCALLAALEEGSLDPGRFASWRKLGRERRHARRRSEAQKRHEERKEFHRRREVAKGRLAGKECDW